MLRRIILPIFAALVFVITSGVAVHAADETEIRDFLKVTGFDVAIASIQQGAMSGPGLTGEDPEVFGKQWIKLAEEVFEPDAMVDEAVEMIGSVMPDELLEHGAAFYGSPLGQRLVEVENESHMADDTLKYEEGEELAEKMVEEGWKFRCAI